MTLWSSYYLLELSVPISDVIKAITDRKAFLFKTYTFIAINVIAICLLILKAKSGEARLFESVPRSAIRLGLIPSGQRLQWRHSVVLKTKPI